MIRETLDGGNEANTVSSDDPSSITLIAYLSTRRKIFPQKAKGKARILFPVVTIKAALLVPKESETKL